MEEIYSAMKKVFDERVQVTDHGLEVISGSKNGYSKINWTFNGVQMNIMAYRASWIIENGPIQEGHDIDHDPSCPKSCVTVSHLQSLSKADHCSLSWRRGEITRSSFMAVQDDRIEKVCPACGVIFLANSTNPNEQIYCDPICQKSAKEERRKRVRYPRPDTKVCGWCEEEFTPKRADTIFCSRVCIDADQNSKKKSSGKYTKVCENPDCQKEFTHNLERVRCCSKACSTSLRHQGKKEE